MEMEHNGLLSGIYLHPGIPGLLTNAKYTSVSLIGSAVVLYAELLLLRTKFRLLQGSIAVLAAAMWLGLPYYAPFQCGVLDSLLRLCCGCAAMKALEMYIRRSRPPIPKYPMSNAWYAFNLLWELRFESFDISTVRAPPYEFNETSEFFLHAVLFGIFQFLPQTNLVKADSMIISIYLLWTFCNYFLRYRHSVALFGPIWRATDLSSFWSETWHNAFSSPCHVLGYKQFRRFGKVPAVCAAFFLMGIWHAWSLAPIVAPAGRIRVLVFFVSQALGCALDTAIWKHHKTTLRMICSWMYCNYWALWTVRELSIPDGVTNIAWNHMCKEFTR